MDIRTPDYRLQVFVSSTLKELAEERRAVRQAIIKLRLAPVMFESGARPYPADELYRSYLSQSHIFIGLYWESYGWIAPKTEISGLETEYNLSTGMPRLIYIKNPAPNREPALVNLLERIRNDNSTSYAHFSTPVELKKLVENDLALLLTEHFVYAQKTTSPSLTSSQSLLSNVPSPRNSIVGREHELKTICDLLSQDEVALITLTGAGGTGKSRLAIQVGLEMQQRFTDGVYLVRLETINDPALVIPTIASTLDVRENLYSRPVIEMLEEFLRDKRILLILDNFEQVVDASTVVAELLEACPQLKVVVTSRMSLHLRAERVVPVPPLKIPSMQKSASVDEISKYSAVELFIQRAKAVKPDFDLTSGNTTAIAQICNHLDGLPLAIELAAARIKLLTPKELLARLGHRFELLRGGTRDLPERQRTLRGAIDWSYNLLNEQEKKLFRRLSIFTGGWTLNAAETVCDIDGDLGPDLADPLASLIDNNLVIHHQDTEDHARFNMLSTIHEYASERLQESGEADPVHCKHAGYYLDFIKKAEPRVRSAERIRWANIMQREFGNIRGVLEWVASCKECIEVGQNIVIDMKWFWQFGGFIAEGRHWCAQMLALWGESSSSSIRAGLLCIAGELAWTQGDFLTAITHLDESIELSQLQHDKPLLAFAKLVRGMVAVTSGNLRTASVMLQSSLELLNDTDDLWSRSLALSWLGEIALFENDLDRANALCEQSISLARKQGDPWCMMPSYSTFGQMAVLKGDYPTAELNYQEAVDLLKKIGDTWSQSWLMNNLGHVQRLNGKLEQAGINFLEALTIANGLGNRGVVMISLVGTAALITRRLQKAQKSQEEIISMLTLASHLCGATGPHIDSPGIFVWVDSKFLYQSAIDQARSFTENALWERAFEEGKNIPLAEAVGLAVKALKE